MIYVMSDIHGNYSAFQKMLKQINFTDDDILYIAGDLVDYGADSMELICDISMRSNVYSIVGEHDWEALKMLSGFSKMLTLSDGKSSAYISSTANSSDILLATSSLSPVSITVFLIPIL